MQTRKMAIESCGVVGETNKTPPTGNPDGSRIDKGGGVGSYPGQILKVKDLWGRPM